jgi:starch phosphorylase
VRDSRISKSDGPRIAYFSMEIALESEIPTYSGGLGVLAGDTIRSAADLAVEMVAVTLVHRSGYFRQSLDADGHQGEAPDRWQPETRLEPLAARVSVRIGDRHVAIRAWRFVVHGVREHAIPVYLLDTQLPENAEGDRALTDSLYGGDPDHRLRQEAVLGMGGVRMLRALGYTHIDRFHLNEGHAALAVLPLVREEMERVLASDGGPALERAIAAVRNRCVFTTHTPVPAGHDQFPAPLATAVLGSRVVKRIEAITGSLDLNMTELALETSRFVNGVAMRHGEVSQGMFPDYPIRSITNGVHPGTWTVGPFQELFDRHVLHWREDPQSLRYAVGIPSGEIWEAHQRAKRALIERVSRESDAPLSSEVFTLGFARRATAYKRAALFFHDPDRLADLTDGGKSIQLVFAGKAHPRDEEGKAVIHEIFRAARELRGRISVAYLADYDMDLARILCAGCDVWLNTPVAPLEASGTSGMKAALNGVPSLSILDGWWIEGCVEGVTGWAIGCDGERSELTQSERDAEDARALYEKLEGAVLPCFYEDSERFREVMRGAIALNASFFNTHRMMLQYLYDAYREAPAE